MKLTGALAALALAVASAPPAAAADPVTTRIVAEVSPATAVPAGSVHRITGVVLQQTDDGWTPVTGRGEVSALRCADWGGASCGGGGGGTTIGAPADGTFALTVPATITGCHQLVSHPASSALNSSGLALPTTVVLQPSSTGAPAVNPTTGAVEGFLLFSTSFLPSGPTVRVERSETGETWESVTTAVTQKFHRGSYKYYGNVGQPVAGWWRAVYDGTPDFFAASTSAAVHLP